MPSATFPLAETATTSDLGKFCSQTKCWFLAAFGYKDSLSKRLSKVILFRFKQSHGALSVCYGCEEVSELVRRHKGRPVGTTVRCHQPLPWGPRPRGAACARPTAPELAALSSRRPCQPTPLRFSPQTLRAEEVGKRPGSGRGRRHPQAPSVSASRHTRR